MSSQAATTPAGNSTAKKFPDGIPFIIGNEAAERFSFYGMKAILWIYLTALFTNFVPIETLDASVRSAAEARATHDLHIFVAGVYAFPMIGAILADRLLGKYQVILWLSLIYCAGHGVLALAGDTISGVYVGLGLIALGSGGIKPCVSANVGDQFGPHNSHLVSKVYQVFYFSINFGSFFSTLLTPWLYTRFGAEVAFGIPGILMGVATLIFWMGRNKFVKLPANPGGKLGLLDSLASISLFVPLGLFLFGDQLSWAMKGGLSVVGVVLFLIFFRIRKSIKEDTGFMSVLLYALRNQAERKPGQGFFDVARSRFGDEAAEGPAAVLRIMVVFAMVSVFWALFDQHSSSWVNQAARMDLNVTLPFFGMLSLSAGQISAANPIMVMLLIPFLNFAVYNPLQRAGINFSPLRRMTVGMFLAAVAFATVALIQARIDTLAPLGEKVPVLWQLGPYLLMTVAEVLVSITGLEFAYTQAPRTMKSVIMGFWLLCVAFGNKLVAVMAGMENLPLVNFFWSFAGLMAVAAFIFMVLAYFYKGKVYLQEAASH